MNEKTISEAMQNGQAFITFSSQSEIENKIRYKIFDAMKLRGQSGVDDSTMQAIIRKASDVIIRDYPSMTDIEFDIMLEAGISGELTPKETWVTGASILQWMRLYNRHQSRLNVVDEQHEEKTSARRKTQAEIEELNEKACNDKIHEAYEFYKTSGDIFDDVNHDPRAFATPQFASVVYEWYRNKGLIPEPTEQQLQQADIYASNKIAERNARTKREYLPAARQDWFNSHLLALYFATL